MYQKGSKSGPPRNQKWFHLEGPVLAPSCGYMCCKVADLCARKISSLTQATSAAGVLNWGGPCYVAAFSHLFWAKKRPLDFYNFLNFHSRGRRGPRDLSRPASTCFETCLQPCFILRNFRFTTISIHSPAAWKPALRPSLCASCGLKFWQASKVPNSFRLQGCWDSNNSII